MWKIWTTRLVDTSANLPDDALRPLSAATTTGIYFGFAQVLPDVSTSEAASGESKAVLGAEDRGVYPMAMSLGWNPFYKNERLSAVSLNVFLDWFGLLICILDI